MEEQRQSASREDVSKLWPRYFGATLGFQNYWYPVLVASIDGVGTKIKIAALATSFVAALGVVATAPMTTADAGHSSKTSFRAVDGCC